jgi:cytochrome c553
MKIIGAHLVLQTAVLAIAFSGACRAEDATASVSKQEVAAKHGYYPIPRLAGQQTEYLENQLHAFTEHRRTNNIMFNVGHVLSPAMVAALAANFHDLDPKPLGGAPKDLVAAGKKIFEEGIPSGNVPPCASCHGPDGKGNGPFPRLAGQLSDYVSSKLTNWDKERGQDPKNPDNSAIMEPIAHGLNEAQIKAVAAYVSYLE